MSSRDIASALRLTRSGRGWRGDCPACGYTDAFTMREGRNGAPQLFCASCKDHDALARAIGQQPAPRDPSEALHRRAEDARKTDVALRLWRSVEPARGTPAAVYLGTRHLAHLVDCPDIGFRPDCRHPESGTLAAMVALVRGPAGEPIAVHRTYLARDGRTKASVTPAKASLGPTWGGAVRLAPMAAELAIGEGIETAAAAGLLTGLSAWAAISAGNLEKGLALPVGVRSVAIAVDRDAPGQQASRAAAARWRAEGRHVRLLIPDLLGQDVADVLATQRAGEAAAASAGFHNAERERLAGEVAHA